ncbi:MAG: TonB-dependent receptor [Porticoccaceae bacterium]|nr:TonB-dependent receptor [Porticoccaceae bacterium]
MSIRHTCRYFAYATAVATSALAVAEPLQVAHFHTPRLEEIIVTSTREARARQELPESVGVLDRTAIEQVAPSHPSELLNRLAGVHVNHVGGEGHMTAIRQPLTTGGVYLFLEDGIPTRPTGFFNHNGLYEIDMSQAARVEVTRGPGSALYGSDAIGGLINSLTREPGDSRELEATLEANEHEGYRALLAASGPLGEADRIGVQVNFTDQSDFRDHGDYRRLSVTARWDRDWTSTLSSQTVLAWSDIDQSGISTLDEEDYRRRPRTNYYRGDVGFREVQALRLSSAWVWEPDDRVQWSITAFYRDNRMDLMPFWMLSYDPNVYTTEFQTIGLMFKQRRVFDGLNVEWIAGMDVDYTPSSYREHRIQLYQEGNLYVDYARTGRTNYYFDADQLALSPYTQLEWQPLPGLRLTAGLRYDSFEVDYQDRLAADSAEVGVFAPLPFPSRHFRPDSQTVRFDQWSPKLGLVYDLHPHHNLYASRRHAFRAPTAGQLFRGGAVADTTNLEPVTAVSHEVGLRGQLTKRLDYDLALYHMVVEDDIVSLISDGTRMTVNSGESRHKGVELTLEAHLSEHWHASLAWSHSRQDYRDFSTVCGSATCRFDGNAIPRAPRDMGNASLAYQAPDERWRVELEWSHLGRYYTDEANSQRYGGHNLVALRGQYRLNKNCELYGRIHNLTDRRHATYVSNQVGATALDYRPGQPRTATVGVRVRL